MGKKASPPPMAKRMPKLPPVANVAKVAHAKPKVANVALAKPEVAKVALARTKLEVNRRRLQVALAEQQDLKNKIKQVERQLQSNRKLKAALQK